MIYTDLISKPVLNSYPVSQPVQERRKSQIQIQSHFYTNYMKRYLSQIASLEGRVERGKFSDEDKTALTYE